MPKSLHSFYGCIQPQRVVRNQSAIAVIQEEQPRNYVASTLLCMWLLMRANTSKPLNGLHTQNHRQNAVPTSKPRAGQTCNMMCRRRGVGFLSWTSSTACSTTFLFSWGASSKSHASITDCSDWATISVASKARAHLVINEAKPRGVQARFLNRYA